MPIALRNEEGYLTAAEHLLYNGAIKDDRTGTGTHSDFGTIQVEYDLELDGQPTVCLPSTKNVFWEKAVVELIWMLSGSNRLKFLIDNDVTFWNNWVLPGTEVWKDLTWQNRRELIKKKDRISFDTWFDQLTGGQDEDGFPELDAQTLQAIDIRLTAMGVPTRILIDGDLGPVYGVQWRHWQDYRLIDPSVIYGTDAWAKYGSKGFEHIGTADNGQLMIGRTIDQIKKLEAAIMDRDQKAARRLVLTAWNAAFIEEMALPPCHTLAQWCIEPNEHGDEVLHCKLYQRSGDWFLGVPYNVAFYSIFTHMLCAMCDLKPGRLYHTVGDAHIYTNHVDQIKQQLATPINPESKPVLQFNRVEMGQSLLDYRIEDVLITGYLPGEYIAAPVAE
jgi:thymidylate synthase